MSTIIFPTDFSDISVSALPWALDMANTLNANIHCLYVVEEPQIYSTLDMGAVAIPTAGELVESAETRMKDFVAKHLNNSPHGHESSIVVGHAATEVVNYANKVNAKLIVMTTHGYSGMKHVLLGSTTEDVLRHASCPVLSIRGNT